MNSDLDHHIFAQILRFAPLVSIDLIIRSPDQGVLVGLRNNDPAKGFYFVPGGRIKKGETIARAFARILHTETGLRASFDSFRLRGVYEHMYETNRFDDPEYGTHYVVLAYEIEFEGESSVRADAQHSELVWMSLSDLISSPLVHPYTKAYFE